jgi:hypothetical protein
MKRNCRLQTKYITESISSVVTVTITEHLTVFYKSELFGKATSFVSCSTK